MSNTWGKIFFMIILIFVSSRAFPAEKMQVAVLDLEAKGVSKIVAGAVTDIIRSEMVKTGLFTIVERARMDEILKEQAFQMTGCTDQTCAVQIGKLLSARKILAGEVNKVGQAFMLTVRIVDVEKGTSDFAANEKAGSEDALDTAAKSITRSLAQNIIEGNKEFFVERITPGAYYGRALVPGWGQFYAGEQVKGYAYMGVFAAAAGFTVYAWFNYSSAKKDYDDVQRGAPQSEFDSKYDSKKKAASLFFVGLGVTGAAYIANWIDIVFFTKPKFGERSARSAGDVFYNISLYPAPGNSRDRVTRIAVGCRF